MKMNKIKLTVLLSFFIVLLVSCKSEREKQWESSEMAERLFEHNSRGWKSNQLLNYANNIQYRATEVPIEYYLLKNLGTKNIERFDSIYKANNNERIIEFEFEHIRGNDLLEEAFTGRGYDEGVEYLMETIKQDYTLVTQSGHTIACDGVLFERHFQVSPFKRLLLYFSGVDEGESVKLIYNDQLFNNIQFEFDFGNNVQTQL
ncbi:hypothetical protein [Gilvibacter sp.]|uniref:hypothetical protein n=1 Tax=Gilvibacter sp. TaxID=2729997 RepID=UPI003F4A5769